ncbi:fumarylacetoacetate hydrolase family protein [Alteromonas aestuariivivens]|uniref:Fumarylacetoacetate hydrolase family protein n=1 Tax=Alteromonas aestuariivivens TaxID=1938339 RepID=A0A3D8M4Y8_9ALTE|nr:fumarylacetoacetate hydrolase family protein [Alteromonas aestuariivivens]RDV24640.1 fumarylacetoacetate hydrolase family protein [Alteromonas aestuariivivens]
MYQHQSHMGQLIDLPLGKVVCVGRNYYDHIQEMHSEVPSQPLLFMKPSDALCSLYEPLQIPTNKGECHNELELAVLVSQRLKCASASQVKSALYGIGLALDLTLRDVQAELKSKGHPWERAKAFDASCPVSGFVPIVQFSDLADIPFSLTVNAEVRQQGNSGMMLYDVLSLIALMSHEFTLNPGDIVLTGTPKGVASLIQGDELVLTLPPYLDVHTRVSSL